MITVLSPIPAVVIGWFLNKKLGKIEVHLNGEMEELRERLAAVEGRSGD